MTLRVVQIPDPPPGVDWATVVPGNYFYDVTGITAQLATGTGAPGTAPDVSGNGHDGAYSGAPAVFVPGLVAGDTALQAGQIVPFSDDTGVTMPGTSLDITGDFACAFWIQQDVTQRTEVPELLVFNAADNVVVEFNLRQVPKVDLEVAALGLHWEAALPYVYYDNLPHMIAVDYNSAGPTATFYYDGVPMVTAGPFAIPVVAGAADHTTFCLTRIGHIPRCSGIVDELACFDHQLGAPAWAGIYAASFVDFASYTAAVLAESPSTYYHLDDPVGTGRQPSLIVTDGTTEVVAMPSGFPAVATPGPYLYSWQPGLNADTQSLDGTLTTVAIPPLLLPPGYTINARTLDLQPADQWSQVRLWWDDAYQRQVHEFRPYEYPPGATLVYQQIGT